MALQDSDDKTPYAVMAVDPDEALPRRYVPGQGLVDWPGLAMFVINGEPGMRSIDEATTIALMKQGVGEIDPAIVASDKGVTSGHKLAGQAAAHVHDLET